MRIYLLVLCVLLFSSCARVLNGKYTTLQIISDKATVLLIQNDSITLNNSVAVSVPRSAKPLEFQTLHQDSVYKHQFKAINSFAYYLNLNVLYGLGMLIDANSDKRYTYPQKIWIKNNKALDYNHKNPNFKFDNIIKATFINAFDFNDFIEPSVYYERRINSFSSATIGFGIPLNSLGRTRDLKGFRVGYEHKFYFSNKAPLGQYIGLEFNYFKANYFSDVRFVNEDADEEYPYDPFAIGILLRTIFDVDENSYSEWTKLQKQNYTFNVKYGVQGRINRFMLDFSVGLGLKNRNVKHYNRFRPQDEVYQYRYDFFNMREEQKEGESWSLTLPLNLKIGYSF